LFAVHACLWSMRFQTGVRRLSGFIAKSELLPNSSRYAPKPAKWQLIDHRTFFFKLIY
jgi:hypothetical protein